MQVAIAAVLTHETLHLRRPRIHPHFDTLGWRYAGFVDGPFTYVNSTGAELDALGFANLTSGAPVVSYSTGGCSGCYSLAAIPTSDGALPLKAYFQFTFDGGTPLVNDGMFVVMTFDFSDPSFGINQFIDIVNGSSAEAYTTAYSPNPSCSFADFLPADQFDPASTVVFRWVPTATQSVWTFGWDFTGGGAFQGGLFPGVSVTGANGLPAPGALALLGLGGLVSRRRR